jgi:GGDEF domain-containing protein
VAVFERLLTAKRLLSAMRDFDSIGRIGGDEFLVVMPISPGPAC